MRRQEPWKCIGCQVDTLGAGIQHDHMIVRTRKRIVPAECLHRTLQFATASERSGQTNGPLDEDCLTIRLVSTPRIHSIEESSTMRLIKLIRGVSPCLEQGVGEEAIAHDTLPQLAIQYALAPCPIKKPVVGHIVIIANHVGCDVRQRSPHLRKCRAKFLQLLRFLDVLLLHLSLLLRRWMPGMRIGMAILWNG